MHVRIRMNSFVLRATRTTLATFVLGASAVACCSGVDDPDTQLQVELNEEVTVDANGDAEFGEAQICGADVVAVGGEERIPMDEVQLESGCVYRADGVDPEVVYEIEASHPDYGNGNDAITSNPSCSARTSPDTTDLAFNLAAAGDAQIADGPSLDEGQPMNAER